MRLPRGSALTLISVATGVVAAVAVGTAWFPLIREREARALDDQARQLELVTLLAGDRLLSLLDTAGGPLLDSRLQAASPPDAERVAVVRSASETSLQRIAALAELQRLLLVDPRGRLLASVPPRPVALYGDLVPDPALQACSLDQVMGSGSDVRADFRDPDRGRRQAICAPLRASGDAIVAVLVAVGDSDAVLRRSRQRGRDALLLLTVASVAALVAIAGMRRLLAPLTAVSNAAARIASGERDVRVQVDGPQEMQQLARAMNALASSVESREDEIGGRMQVVHQLSRMVAHEVRNPLQSLSLLVTLARTEPDPDSRDKQLRLIEDEIHVLEGVVQRFLSQSGPLRVARSETDLAEVLERAAAIAHPRAASKGVRLRIQAPPRLPVVADGPLLRRALENLMLNAIEFAGTVPGRPGLVVVSLMAKDDQVRVVVDDDGPGVPVEQRERIFEADVTTKVGGTGLGLALVRQVLDAHGGDIRCEDAPIKGARFVATIPVRPPSGGEA
ncbi:HAMP domain-containing histidine kinase [Myxococcota bacterium]|nr:HAMP domain-containing histidine kinase [Myxococcota bacterium]